VSDQRLFVVPQEQLTRDDYYTPKWIFDRMGLTFDLDVSSPPGGIEWLPATRYFTQEDDGLVQPWSGRVWMNPPYSQSTPWVRKFIEHHHGDALLPHAKSAWHPLLWATDAALVVPEAYFNFVGPSNGSIMLPVFFAAFGEECVEAISRLGAVRKIA
jgi:hypothetical protein